MEETWTKQDSLDIWCYSNFSSSWMWEQILHAICKAVKSSGQDWVPVQVAQPCTAWQGLIPFEQSWILLMFPTASVLWHCFAHGVLLACMHQYAYNMYMKCYEITSDTLGGVKHLKFNPITPGRCWTRICKSPFNYHPQGISSTLMYFHQQRKHIVSVSVSSQGAFGFRTKVLEPRRQGFTTWLQPPPDLRIDNPVSGDVASFGAMLEACDFVSKGRSPAHLCRSASMRCESILLLKAKMQVFEHICCVPVARMAKRRPDFFCIEVGQNDVR